MNFHFSFPCRAASFVVLALLFACNQPASEPEKKPVPVKVRVVERNAAGADARYSGTLEPLMRVDMAFRVGGYVEALGEVEVDGKSRPLEKGDPVKKGAILARLRRGDYTQKVATASAVVSEAKASARLAEQELERAKKLIEGNTIAKAELDVKEARFESARANVEGTEARARDAAISLEDTVLYAPMDGVVLTRNVEVGTLAAPGVTALVIADVRTVKAVFGAPQSLVEKLKVGGALAIYVGADGESGGAGEVIDAKVTRIAPAAESAGRVFMVESALANENGRLRPGSVVSVRVPDAAVADTMIVPLSAIVRSPRDARGFSVFVLDSAGDRAKVRLHDVKLGDILGNGVTVVDGLTLGARVVTVGATLLHEGDLAVVIR